MQWGVVDQAVVRFNANSLAAQCTKANALRWLRFTPFGRPVDPDV